MVKVAGSSPVGGAVVTRTRERVNMPDDQYGQICGRCTGSGVGMEEKQIVLDDGTVGTTMVVGACRDCQGTGWLGGRSR